MESSEIHVSDISTDSNSTSSHSDVDDSITKSSELCSSPNENGGTNLAHSTRSFGQTAVNSSRAFSTNRGPVRKAMIWQHFETTNVVNEKTGKIEKISTCSHCKYQSKGTFITNLKGHLKSKHVAIFREMEDKEKELKAKQEDKIHPMPSPSGPIQRTLTSLLKPSQKSKMPYDRKSEKFIVLKNGLTAFAACTSFPLSLVESSEFHSLINGLDPRAADSLPTRNTLKNWVMKFTENLSAKTVVSMKNSGGFFVAIDLWSQPGLTNSYIGMTSVFYNPVTKRFEKAALCCR